MPLGEILTELGLRVVIEFIVYGITYWLGFVVLKILSLGQLPIAPFSTIQERNRGRKLDWSIWLYSPFGPKALKADCACLVGFLFLVVIGVGFYFSLRAP